MAQSALQDGTRIPTLATSYISQQTPEIASQEALQWRARHGDLPQPRQDEPYKDGQGRIVYPDSTGKGILIGMLSAFGSAALVAIIIGIVYFFRYTNRGRILLDRIGRPGEFDDEQQFLREEEDAMGEMDESQRAEYLRAKGEDASMQVVLEARY